MIDPPKPPSSPSSPSSPPKLPSSNGAAATTETPRIKKNFSVSSGIVRDKHKIGIYGRGGVGKTSLASLIKKVGVEPFFIDLDHGSEDIDVSRIGREIETWDDLRDILHNKKLLEPYGAIIIDSATKAQELAVEWTLKNIPRTSGKTTTYVKNLKSYGWADGDAFLYDTFLQMLGDLDHLANSKHIILICHACEAEMPNPEGENYLSYMPLLARATKGDIRSRVRDWVDHLLYVEIQRFVSEEKRAVGDGTRMIYPVELPYAWAKSRTLRDPMIFNENDPELWKIMFNERK